MFVDRVIIQFFAGKGGNGVVAWRREKYIPKGGPSGGDGGKGGSVTLIADTQVPSLDAYRNRRIVKSENGQQGGGGLRKGRNGKNLLLKVPCGTLVKDAATGELIADLSVDKERLVLCQGGRGGKGNNQFKSPTNRAPNQCTPGRPGEIKKVELELKLIADVGLVGFPNAGKSTLLSQMTQREVKAGAYPFTTLKPNLGFIEAADGRRIVIADIPGIIRGAHNNRGLGLAFLRHIERTKFLLFMIDISGFEVRDPCEDYAILRNELRAYKAQLLNLPHLIVLNKIDIEGAQAHIKAFRKMFKGEPMIEISALSGDGLEALVNELKAQLLSCTEDSESK